MATVLRIIDLNGRTINVVKGSGQSWKDVVKKANLPSRFGFCLKYWLSDDPENTALEERVKAYLDRVGYILIQDKPDAKIITDYKELRDKVALIPVSGITHLENVFYSHAEEDVGRVLPERGDTDQMTRREKKVYNALTCPRRKNKTVNALTEKRKRLDMIHRQFTDAVITFARVDTDNEFTYNNERWRIDDLAQYRAKHVHGDELYDMDQVVCVRTGDRILFYDQNYKPITEYVHRV